MEHYMYRHYLIVGNATLAVAMTLFESSIRCYFSSTAKYLQN